MHGEGKRRKIHKCKCALYAHVISHSPFMPYYLGVDLIGMTCPINDARCGSAEGNLRLLI